MSQELNSYIYLLEEKKGSSHNIISFEPTLSAAQKTLTKLVEREKNTLGVDGAQIYTTKSLNKNSITIFRDTVGYLYNAGLIQEKTIFIKRVSNHPPDLLSVDTAQG